AAPLSARRKKRSINSNSVSAAIVAGRRLGSKLDDAKQYAGSAASGRGASAGNLRRPNACRQPVEHAVDILVTVGASIRFGKLDGFVDRHAVGHVRLPKELPGTDGEDA